MLLVLLQGLAKTTLVEEKLSKVRQLCCLTYSCSVSRQHDMPCCLHRNTTLALVDALDDPLSDSCRRPSTWSRWIR